MYHAQIEVDLSMNAAANARVRHEARKRHTAKQQRTADAATRVMAAAKKKTAAQLAQVPCMYVMGTRARTRTCTVLSFLYCLLPRVRSTKLSCRPKNTCHYVLFALI